MGRSIRWNICNHAYFAHQAIPHGLGLRKAINKMPPNYGTKVNKYLVYLPTRVFKVFEVKATSARQAMIKAKLSPHSIGTVPQGDGLSPRGKFEMHVKLIKEGVNCE